MKITPSASAFTAIASCVRRATALAISILILAALPPSTKADPAPTLIPFQGRLTDQNGNPYSQGQYTITFGLYDVAVGGTPFWTETHQRVGVVNGMVNVFLGSINALDQVDFSEIRHLGIKIDADNSANTPDPEMVPRQMIIPAFWAKQADNSTKLLGHDWSAILVAGNTNPATHQIDGNKVQIADGHIATRMLADSSVTSNKLATGAIGTTGLANGAVTSQKIADGTILTNDLAASLLKFLNPPGTIVAFAGPTNNIPYGWLLCDGRDFQTNEFPELYSAIGKSWGSIAPNWYKLPDLRGYFLRGAALGQSTDPDRSTRTGRPGGNTGDAVGSTQSDNVGSHRHRQGGTAENNFFQFGYHDTSGYRPSQVPATGYYPFTSYEGGSETRPKNAYVNYIIKY